METLKQDISGNEKLEILLEEFADEQKSANQKYDDLVKAFNELSTKVNSFEDNLKNHKVIAPEPDVKPIQQIVEKGKEEIKQMIATALRGTRTDHWRIFLESDAKKWVVVLLISLTFLTYLYFFCVHWIDQGKAINH